MRKFVSFYSAIWNQVQNEGRMEVRLSTIDSNLDICCLNLLLIEHEPLSVSETQTKSSKAYNIFKLIRFHIMLLHNKNVLDF